MKSLIFKPTLPGKTKSLFSPIYSLLFFILFFFIFKSNISSQTSGSKTFSPYANYTYFKTNTVSYGNGIETKVGYCPTTGQNYKHYRKAMNFSIGTVPSNATVTSCTMAFYSGEECGVSDGTIKFTKIPYNFPTLFNDQQVYNLISSGDQINTIAITSTQTYNVTLSSLNQDIQNAIQSSYPYVGIGGINTGETQQQGTSFSNVVLTINYTIPTPPAPTNIQMTSRTSSSISLQWTASTGNVTGYYIYKNDVLYSTTSSTSITISGLCPGTSYTVKIVPYNSYGPGESASTSRTTLSPTLSGTTPLCASTNYTFSINDCPPNNGITWTKSSNINYVSGQGTQSFVVNTSSSGSGWIKATFTPSSGSCSQIILQYNVWLGPPSVTISGPTEGYIGNSYTFYEYPVGNSTASSFDWSLTPPYDGNNIYNYGYWANAAFYGYPGYFQIGCTPTNSCGTGSMATTYIDIYESLGLSIYPNPASSEVTVSIIQNMNIQNNVELAELNFVVSIYDMFGAIHSKKEYSGTTFSIPVNNLKDGNYIIRFDNGKNILTKNLIVKH